MKHRLSLDAGRLVGELAGLPALDRRALIEKWRILYGTEPPGGVRNNFLMYAIAHRMQDRHPEDWNLPPAGFWKRLRKTIHPDGRPCVVSARNPAPGCCVSGME